MQELLSRSKNCPFILNMKNNLMGGLLFGGGGGNTSHFLCYAPSGSPSLCSGAQNRSKRFCTSHFLCYAPLGSSSQCSDVLICSRQISRTTKRGFSSTPHQPIKKPPTRVVFVLVEAAGILRTSLCFAPLGSPSLCSDALICSRQISRTRNAGSQPTTSTK